MTSAPQPPARPDPAAVPDPSALLAEARMALQEHLTGPAGPPGTSSGRTASRPRRPSGTGPTCHVNVTLYVRGLLRASMSSRADSHLEATATAAHRAADDERFGGRLRACELPATRIEVWVQTGSEPLNSIYVEEDLDLGRHGVALSGRGRSAYFKPSVALTTGTTSPAALFEQLTRKAGLPAGAWRDPNVALTRTTWLHFTEHPQQPGRPLRLYRMRTAPEEARWAAGESAARATLALARLARIQQPDGFLLYRHHPFRNHDQPGPGHIVRQAGCALALAAGVQDPPAESGPDSASPGALLLTTLTRLVDALLSRVVTAGGRRFVPDLAPPHRGSLGTLALLLTALQQPALGARYAADRDWLTAALVAARQPDGSLRARADPGPDDEDLLQDFYPGEALLALASGLRPESGVDPVDPAFFGPSLAFYRRRFRTHRDVRFAPWQVLAWCRYADWAGGTPGSRGPGSGGPTAEEAAAFAFELTDAVLAAQHQQPQRHPDFAGGIAVPGHLPSAGTTMYVEALVRALELAHRLDDARRVAAYRTAALGSLAFARRLQIDARTAGLFRVPELAVGGTSTSLSDLTLRCDWDQHAATAYLAAAGAEHLLLG